VGVGKVRAHAAPLLQSPFAAAEPVEGDHIRAIEVGEPTDPPSRVAFLDGIQRYAVEGYLGIVPVVRGYVAAAVVRREQSVLRAVLQRVEEFLTVPLEHIAEQDRSMLEQVPLPLYDCSEGDRPHPILDVQLAALAVERRREELERRLAVQYLETAPEEWLVADGSVADLMGPAVTRPRLVGLVKSHDTQFLEGRELEVALTLPSGHRSSVFARHVGKQRAVYTWYLRLWPWEEHDLLYGLVRVERAPVEQTVAEASAVSRWILAERAPLSAPDERWDRLIYPIRQVEAYLRSHIGGWW
jgi:hypothetical protein